MGKEHPLEGHHPVPSFDRVYSLLGRTQTEAPSVAGIQYETGDERDTRCKQQVGIDVVHGERMFEGYCGILILRSRGFGSLVRARTCSRIRPGA